MEISLENLYMYIGHQGLSRKLSLSKWLLNGQLQEPLKGMHCSFFLWPFVFDNSLKYLLSSVATKYSRHKGQGTREVLLTGSYTHPLSTQVEKRCFRFCNSYPTET